MPEETSFPIEQAHRYFAVEFNNALWPILERPSLTEAEMNELVNLAHASLLHWSRSPGCKKVNLQRGEYMIALSYITAKRKEPAIYYAQRCLQMTREHPEQNKDFDLPYALLVMAGAMRLNEQIPQAGQYMNEALRLGEEIKNAEDKRIFMDDVKSFYGR